MNYIDVKGGQMTFGQRIELGKIITDDTLTEYQKFKQAMLCLDPTWQVHEIDTTLGYWYEVIEGISHWVHREAVELKYKPTADELAAGVEALGLAVGEMSTIMALAKDYAQDPDEILKWKYGKVFNILYTNLHSFLYRERLEKRMLEKAKADSRRGRNGRR